MNSRLNLTRVLLQLPEANYTETVAERVAAKRDRGIAGHAVNLFHFGAGTGMHLSLRCTDPDWRDDRIGIAAHCMTRHETGLRKTGWNGLLLGYSQVPATDVDDAARRLAAVAFRHRRELRPSDCTARCPPPSPSAAPGRAA
jgi:hypothetical protein